MSLMINRRAFVQKAATGVSAGSMAVADTGECGSLDAVPFRQQMKKAVKFGMIRTSGTVEEKFSLLKKLGYDGVEVDSPTELDRDEVLAARDSVGSEIHGVVDSAHWRQPLSDPDLKVRKTGIKALQTALHDAKYYRASTVLLVPAVVSKNVSYSEAYKRSQEAIHEVLPLASELGVKIAIENVWNQFLLSPLEFARYLDEFENDAIGAYFDVGNIVNYGWPEHWIAALGHRILKLDIKEYSRSRRDNEGLWKGFQVKIGDGDCDWPAVRRALKTIDYHGWATAEVPGGDQLRLQEVAERMNKVLALT